MITSTLGRMASADKLSVQQLKQAVQNGTVPAYIGIPLLQEKMKQAQQAQASQAGQAPQQPPIADQIMQQAAGVPALQSNLPEQYAHGGVIHLASGGYDPMAMARAYTHDEEELEDMDFLNALGADQMPQTQDYEEQPEAQGVQSDSDGISGLTPVSTLAYAAPFTTTRQADQLTVKQKGEPAQTVRNETARINRPAAAGDFERLALAEGEKYKLDPALIKHVMFKETGNRKDRAGAVSSAGAMGVMQLMPATAKDMGVKDPFDPVQNIQGGVKFLAQMQRKYDDPRLAAIAYNWGPGRTDRWLAQGGDFAKLPKETQGYVKGMARGGMTDDEYDDDIVSTTGGPKSLEDIFSEGQDVAENAEDIYGTPLAQAAGPAPFPEKRTSKAGDILDSTGLPGAYNTYREWKNRNRAEELRKQEVEALKPGLLERMTPTQRAEAERRIELRKKGPQTVKPLSQKELAELFEKNVPPLVKKTDKPVTLAPAITSAPAPAPDVAPQPQMSLSTPEKDAEVAQALADQENPAKQETAKPADRAGYDELKKYFSQGIAGLEEQKKINGYMAMLSAGLGMMGGTSPHAMTNIGQGAQAGVQTYMASNKDVAAQQAAMMQGRLGLEKYQSLRDIQAETIKSRETFHVEAEKRRRELAAQTDARIREIAKGNFDQRNAALEEKHYARIQAEKLNSAKAMEIIENHARVNARNAAQTAIGKNIMFQNDAAKAEELRVRLENEFLQAAHSSPAYLAHLKVVDPTYQAPPPPSPPPPKVVNWNQSKK